MSQLKSVQVSVIASWVLNLKWGASLITNNCNLLALSLSGGCGRREQNTENTDLAVRTLSLRDQVGHL